MLDERVDPPELVVTQHELDRLSAALRREIRRRGVDPETAEDLVQESWLRTLRSPPAERDGRLGGWLRVVGRRLVAELRRSDRNRRSRERAAARAERVEAAAVEPDSLLLRLVGELGEPYREVVRLRFFAGHEVEEIAARLSRPPATVRSQLARGLERLRARLPEPRRRALPAWLALALRRAGARVDRRWALVVAGAVLLVAGAWFLRPRVGVVDAREEQIAALAPLRVEQSRGSRVPVAPSAPPAPVAVDAGRRVALTGRVRTSDGVPVPFARLWSGARTGGGTLAGTADALGAYSVADLPAERFLWADAGGACPSRRVYLGSVGPAARHDLVLARSRGPLALDVRELDGRPAAGVRIVLDGQLGHGPSSAITASGALEVPAADEVEGLTDAAGRVTLPAPDRERLGFSAWRDGRLLAELVLDAAPEGEVRELVLPRAPVLDGLVVDAAGAPLPGAAVHAQQRDGAFALDVCSDAAGRFTLEGLVPGPCGLSVLGRAGLSASVKLVLREGERTLVQLETSTTGTLAGRALDAGAPLAGARVAVYAAGRRGEPAQATCETDAAGRFRFACTAGSEYELELTARGERLPCGWAEGVRPGAEELELRVDPRMSARETLALELVGADPAHAPALVVLRSFQPRLSFEAPVEALRAALELPPLEYELVVWSPGLGSWTHKERMRPAPGLQRVLLPAPGVVRLEVDLAPGTPFEAGVNVAGFNPVGYETLGALACVRELEPDSSGHLLSGELYPGRYSWFVRAHGRMPETAYFWVLPDRTVELRAAPAAGVELELDLELPRELRAGEAIVLTADTPAGEHPLRFTENRKLEHGFAFLLALPADTRALTASTSLGLRGEHIFQPGELDVRGSRTRCELALAEAR